MMTDTLSLETQLKDRATFENAIAFTQISIIFAQLFTLFAALMVAFFILPYLWVTFTGDISAHYNIRFNAKMGGGMAAFLATLALTCYLIGKTARKKLIDRLHQAYLDNPKVYSHQVLLRRDDVVLCAFANQPDQQTYIEALLLNAIKTNPEVHKLAYDELFSAHRKHKALKMDSFKKKLYKHIPGLDHYNFYLNTIKWPAQQGENLYHIHLGSGLPPFYSGYRLLKSNVI